MSEDFISSDYAIIDLLRNRETLTVTQMAVALDVTATAIRQRLTRLMAQGYIDRTATKMGRGRPRHEYNLTERGTRKAGSNFADLAMVLWLEIRQIEDPQVRRGLLSRLAKRLAEMYADRIEGATVEEKMESVAQLFAERRVPFQIDTSEAMPVLTASACPYPELAEEDRSVCAFEKLLFNELLGANVRLDKCRLDGEACCTFQLN